MRGGSGLGFHPGGSEHNITQHNTTQHNTPPPTQHNTTPLRATPVEQEAPQSHSERPLSSKGRPRTTPSDAHGTGGTPEPLRATPVERRAPRSHSDRPLSLKMSPVVQNHTTFTHNFVWCPETIQHLFKMLSGVQKPYNINSNRVCRAVSQTCCAACTAHGACTAWRAQRGETRRTPRRPPQI